MRTLKQLTPLLLAALIGWSGAAHADRGYHRHGPGWGLPLGLAVGAVLASSYARPYYYPPYYPSTVVVQSPPVYIEQPVAVPQSVVTLPPPASYWYFCRNPQGYYPAVRECGEGWQLVPAQR